MKIRIPRIFRKRKAVSFELHYIGPSEVLGKVTETSPGIFEITNLTPAGWKMFNFVDKSDPRYDFALGKKLNIKE